MTADHPLDDSMSLGLISIPELLARDPQPADANPAGKYALYRVGDTVAGRNIPAAIFDAPRLCSVVCPDEVSQRKEPLQSIRGAAMSHTPIPEEQVPCR